MLALLGYMICSHLYFCIGFSTAGNAPEQFIFSSRSVQLLLPLGTERKFLTGRQLPVYNPPPNVRGKSVASQLQQIELREMAKDKR